MGNGVNRFQSVANEYTQAARTSSTTNVSSYQTLKQQVESKKNELDAIEDDVNTTYEVTDDGDSDTKISFWEGAASVLTAAGSAASAVLQATGNKSSATTNANGAGETHTCDAADTLDSAVAEFNKGNMKKEDLASAISTADQALVETNKNIETYTKNNELLEQAVKGDFTGILGDIKQNMIDAGAAIDATNRDIEGQNAKISVIDGAIADNDNRITVNADNKSATMSLTDEQKTALGVTDDNITIKVNAQAQTETNIQELMGQYKTASGEYNEAVSGVSTAEGNLAAEKAKPDKVDDTSRPKRNDDGQVIGYEQKANPDKKVADKEAALAEAKRIKEEKYSAMKAIADNIDIGDKNLGEILEARHTLEGQKSQQEANLNDLATQLKGYINEESTLDNYKKQLEGDQQSSFEKKNEASQLLDVIKGADNEFSNVEIDLKEAMQTANEQLAENKTNLQNAQSDKKALEKSISNANKALVKGGGEKVELQSDKKPEKKDDANGSSTKSQPKLSNDGKTVQYGGATYVVNGNNFGYWENSDGQVVNPEDIKDLNKKAFKFHKVGSKPQPATTTAT
ncbi:hypothetical protein IJ707_01870 [bacterium]|nr:hypothetical protein [bacterium]